MQVVRCFDDEDVLHVSGSVDPVRDIEVINRTHLSCEAVVISAQIESDLVDLEPAEAKEFLQALGVEESGIGALIRATYHLLGLQTYFTAGEKEVRAWTIHHGDTAPKAAGVIHSDFERGFIKAETVAYADLVACGSVAAGLARQRDGLGDHRHRSAQHDLIAGLADLTGARVADVHELLW